MHLDNLYILKLVSYDFKLQKWRFSNYNLYMMRQFKFKNVFSFYYSYSFLLKVQPSITMENIYLLLF